MQADPELLNLRELQEVRSNLLSLKQHPGYQWKLEFLQNQIETRRRTVEAPLTEFLGVLTNEFLKGEIVGMQQASLYVDAQLDLITSLIDEKEKELSNVHSTD
jgi:hypothetical protein